MTSPIVSGKLVFKNAARNLVGYVVPFFLALFTIPQLIAELGPDRFGFLSLLWVIVGYLSIFDLGLGLALTALTAEKIGLDKHEAIPILFWTTCWLLGALSIVGAIALGIVNPYLIGRIFHLPPELYGEAKSAMYWVSLTLPFVIISAGTRGFIEAYQRFDYVTWVRVPLGIYTFSAPLLVARYISNDLSAIAISLLVGRFLFMAVTFALCLRINVSLQAMRFINLTTTKSLLSFGAWMSVANLVGPLMVYLDRFLLASLLSMAAVSYYVVPYEVVSKLLIIPVALVSVLLPAFAINLAHPSKPTDMLLRNSLDAIFLIMFPIISLAIAFADELLTLWLGRDMAGHTTMVFQILAIGVLSNSFCRVPATFLQAAGRPDVPAKLYLMELPFYLYVAFKAITMWGIKGAAIAWVIRIVVDNCLLFFASAHIAPALKAAALRGLGISVISSALLVVIFFGDNAASRIGVSIVAVTVMSGSALWFITLWRGELEAANQGVLRS